MPWDQSYPRIKSLPADARALWVKVANEEHAKHNDDGSAQASGWAAVKGAGFEKSGHKWIKKNQEDNVGDKFTAPVRITKAREGDGEMYVTITASGVNADRQNEKMDPEFLNKILKSAKAGEMGIRESHSAVFDIGRSHDAVLQPNGDADFEFKLDKSMPFAPYLFEKVKKGEAAWQGSLDGFSTNRGFEWDNKLQKMVKVLKDGVIKFVACTPPGESAYPTAGFTEAIVKQVSWEQEPPAPTGSVEKIEKVEATVSAPENQGGGSMEDLVKQVEGIAEGISKSMAPQFKLEANMFEDVAGTVILRKDFQEQYDSSKPELSAEQVERIEKSMEKILNAIGTKTVDFEEIRKAAAKPAAPAATPSKTEALKKALGLDVISAELQVIKKGIETSKGRPAVTGAEIKIVKAVTDLQPEDLTIQQITKSMATVGAAVRSGKLTAADLDSARSLNDSFLKSIAGKAIQEDMISVGVVQAQ